MDQHIERVAGIDLGDTHCSVCIIDASAGEVLERSEVRTRVQALTSCSARTSSSVLKAGIATCAGTA